VLVPIALVFVAMLTDLGTVLLFVEGDLQVSTIPPVGGLISAGLVAGLAVVLRGPLVRTVAPRRQAGARREDRLRRYRVALERRRGGAIDEATLLQVQESLDVSEEEHQALVSVLDRNVVPTDLVHGAEPGTRVAGRFEVQRELGAGGQGRAMLARDLDTDELVVLKELVRPWEVDADDRAGTLRREAQAARRVDDEHVATVEGTIEDGRRLYLVPEFVPGRTLAEALDTEGPPRPRSCARRFKRIAEGLDAIHAAGLANGDVKPANVVTADDGRPVLLDRDCRTLLELALGALGWPTASSGTEGMPAGHLKGFTTPPATVDLGKPPSSGPLHCRACSA